MFIIYCDVNQIDILGLGLHIVLATVQDILIHA